ncbi:helix-turn-helix domain-containing protein [Companilactobacillus allii]|uniref:Uncharacterized protein n=1 Tax=Companilactobacillus allii TaxID=1847728 RepID=A0A1P8Q4W3_9LACO|nr:helix-turn-helix domain-containing protein [Companilactobacillus allii]APX72888.1 hypothetical protein BTM29_10135 [Companilactobacillus allii]USQ67676.1 helix-turn-helix domain-containing protein [Companilactobacillus allii]
MNQQEIKNELEDLLTRECFSHKDLAQEIHVRESTISNWMNDVKRSIPADKLLLISKNFSDLKFKRAVGDYLTEMPVIFSENKIYQCDSAALYLASEKEEMERESLDKATVIYFAKRPELVTEDDRRKIVSWTKEFTEEISSENSLLNSVIEKFQINPLELEIER